ncbi:hypothetical protein ACJRO7_004529 [Eucalyptus globulus]|uniref:Uncharacterized protein n=1 Tax=Eucalyptus globulus TaxID=34317 RepID=A0ABD3J2U2_EUCGL
MSTSATAVQASEQCSLDGDAIQRANASPTTCWLATCWNHLERPPMEALKLRASVSSSSWRIGNSVSSVSIEVEEVGRERVREGPEEESKVGSAGGGGE